MTALRAQLLPASTPRPVCTVVIPTVPGREALLDETIAAYQATGGARVAVIRGARACGDAWAYGATFTDRTRYVHFGADDLVPHPGWLAAATEAADAGVQPAAVVWRPDGSVESAGLTDDHLLTDPAGGVVQASGVPFLRVEWWTQVAPLWPRDLHYSTDLLLSALLTRQGVPARVTPGYAFTHHLAAAGRLHDRVGIDFARYREVLACG